MRNRRGYVSPFVVVLVVTVAIVTVCVWLLGGGGGRGGAAGTPGGELVLYCAAGMMQPVAMIAADYERETGVKVQIEPGPSGALLSKIRATQGERRPHIYLAADRSYIDEAKGHGVVAEAVPVAYVHPVIVVRRGNPKGIKGIGDLLRSDVRVVLANPVASIGSVSKRVLSERGEWDALHARSTDGGTGVSYVGTVNEVTKNVELDSADAGIVWDAVARAFDVDLIEAEAFADVRETMHVGVIEPNAEATASLRFVRYLTAKDRGLRRFAEHGFAVPEVADEWAARPRVLLMAGAMLKPAIEDAVTRFEHREGVEVDRVYNGCGVLVSQMKTGTQPEAYFSCDVSFMDAVAERFGPSVHVSRNPMVILVPPGNPRGIKSLHDLRTDGLKIGLAHPENSALGALTEQMLVKLGIRDEVYTGSTVVHSDAGHMLVNQMAVGSLDAAVVYRSNALASESGAERYEALVIDLPEAMAEQPYAVSKSGKHPQLMHRLLEAITAEQGRKRFDEIGFLWLLDGGAGGKAE